MLFLERDSPIARGRDAPGALSVSRKLMHSPARRCSVSERTEILSDNQRCQYVPYPVHEVWAQATWLITLDEAFQSTMAHGSNDHCLECTVKQYIVQALCTVGVCIAGICDESN